MTVWMSDVGRTHAYALRKLENAPPQSSVKYISKSASKAGEMPTDHLPKHGTSACSQTLFLRLLGAVSEYLRGGWEYLRGSLKTFGELGIFTGQ